MQTDPQIRPMRESDFSEVLRIEREVFADPWPLEAFNILPQERSWVLCLDGILRGYIMFHLILDEAIILNFAIDADFWRQGWGELLLQHSLKTLLAEGASKIFLEVRESNLAAQKLYEKHGFINLGVRRDYYKNPSEDAIVMVRYEHGHTHAGL